MRKPYVMKVARAVLTGGKACEGQPIGTDPLMFVLLGIVIDDSEVVCLGRKPTK